MSDARRYVVRLGKVRGEGKYVTVSFNSARQRLAERFTREKAVERAAENCGRVVRLLTREEAKRRFAAKALRELAAELRTRAASMLYGADVRGFEAAADAAEHAAAKLEAP